MIEGEESWEVGKRRKEEGNGKESGKVVQWEGGVRGGKGKC